MAVARAPDFALSEGDTPISLTQELEELLAAGVAAVAAPSTLAAAQAPDLAPVPEPALRGAALVSSPALAPVPDPAPESELLDDGPLRFLDLDLDLPWSENFGSRCPRNEELQDLEYWNHRARALGCCTPKALPPASSLDYGNMSDSESSKHLD